MTAPRKEVLSDGIEIWLGDCRDVLPLIGRVDAVVTDPPYGLSGSDTDKNLYVSFSDEPAEVLRLVSDVLSSRIWARLVMTPGQSMMFKYPEPNAVGAFYYPAGTGSCSWGFVGWQPIFYYGKDPILARGGGRASNSFESTESAEKNGHPCPKPIGAWSKLVKRATELGELVCDPFMGSGTTGVACVNLGRKFIGVEQEPKYFDIARRRISEALSRPRLPFEEPVKVKQESLL